MYILYYQAETESKPMHTNKSHLNHSLCLQNANDITVVTASNVCRLPGTRMSNNSAVTNLPASATTPPQHGRCV
jgi:hypothetical protein